jgi:hypothetical protein
MNEDNEIEDSKEEERMETSKPNNPSRSFKNIIQKIRFLEIMKHV